MNNVVYASIQSEIPMNQNTVQYIPTIVVTCCIDSVFYQIFDQIRQIVFFLISLSVVFFLFLLQTSIFIRNKKQGGLRTMIEKCMHPRLVITLYGFYF